MAKMTFIELESKSLGSRKFGIEHATAILADKGNKPENGWYLPETSEYELVNGVIIKKQNVNNKRYKRNTSF